MFTGKIGNFLRKFQGLLKKMQNFCQQVFFSLYSMLRFSLETMLFVVCCSKARSVAVLILVLTSFLAFLFFFFEYTCQKLSSPKSLLRSSKKLFLLLLLFLILIGEPSLGYLGVLNPRIEGSFSISLLYFWSLA